MRRPFREPVAGGADNGGKLPFFLGTSQTGAERPNPRRQVALGGTLAQALAFALTQALGGCAFDRELPPRIHALPDGATEAPGAVTGFPSDQHDSDTGDDETSSGPREASTTVRDDAPATVDASRPRDASAIAPTGAHSPASPTADAAPEASTGQSEAGQPHPSVPTGDASADAGLATTDARAPTEGAPSLSGRLRVIPNLVVDGDCADARRPRVANDELDTLNPARDLSQLLLKPTWVAGYLGPLPEAASLDAGVRDGGAAGEPSDVGAVDEVDYYKVRLKRGDPVTLYFEDDVDLDLYLLEHGRADITAAGQWVDDSQGSGNIEQVRAPLNGTYWLAVKRYVADGQDPAALRAARYALTVAVPIAPSVQQRISKSKLSTLDMAGASGAWVQLGEGASAQRVEQELDTSGGAAPNALGFRRARLSLPELAPAARAQRTLRWIKQLRATPGVLAANPVRHYWPQSVTQPDDPERERQWYHEPIDLSEGWAQSVGLTEGAVLPSGALGEGVIVAVVDTGIAATHPDFVNLDGSTQLVAGMDMVSDSASARDGDGIDSDPTDPRDPTQPGGGNFHGTHCAGNIAAATDNALGIAGTAPRAQIMPVRVLGKAGGEEQDIADGILYAAGLPNSSGSLPERPADVISLSLGGSGRSAPLAAAVASAVEAGAIVVAAAGNTQSLAEEYSPGGEEGVITVSAIDARYDLSWYSNYGATSAGIDLAGVGGDTERDYDFDGFPDGIWSLSFADVGTTLYADEAGTSMASAQVAGVVALMKGAWPQMTTADLMAMLPEITIDLGDAGPDPWFGHGLISAPLAVAAAQMRAGSDASEWVKLRSSALALDFGSLMDTLPLEITSVGSGTLELTGVRSDSPWLRVAPGALGVNTVVIDRGAIDESGVEALGTLEFESTAGSLPVTVRALPDLNAAVGDVGELVVALLDVDRAEVVAEVVASSASGYTFAFYDVPPGAYRIVAGADLLGHGAEQQFAGFHASAPFAGGVLCVQLQREDCSTTALDDVRLSIELLTGGDSTLAQNLD
jgi:serine protease